MTVKEVLSDASAYLGGWRILPDSRAFGAVRRALYTVFRDTGCEASGKILAVGTRPISRVRQILHTPGECEGFTVTGGAYTFEVSGKGSFSVTDRRGERKESFDTDGALFKGRLEGGGCIRFFGDGGFAVFNLTDYPAPASDSRLPDGSGEMHYDLTGLVSDFLALSSEPTDACGEKIKGLRTVGGVIHLPEEYCGEVRFDYHRRPTSPVTEEGEELDLPEGCEMLFIPLLCAYLTAREDSETSAECLKCYRDMLAQYPKAKRYAPPEIYYCKSRWA